jgi:hypothetical protein
MGWAWHFRTTWLPFLVAACTHRFPAPAPPPAVPAQVSNPPPQPACASSSAETARAVGTLIEAQRAYLERGDTKPFSLLMLSDVKVEACRARAPGPFDLVFNKSQLDGINQWAAQNEGQSAAEFTAVETRATSDSVGLELRLDLAKETGERASFGQRFELACRSETWRIERFRYWPLDPDTGEDFTQFFQATDASIERDLSEGDLRNAAYHLMLAYRFNECAALSRRLTSDTPDDAWAWELRAKASALTGDRDDADQSIQIAHSLARRDGPK